jgi:hypothetical protein
MESYIYFTIAISSILVFVLIVAAGIISTAIVNIVAQEEGVVNPPAEDLVNDTQIDKDKGTTRSSTEFSAVNDTISGQNTSQWNIQH